jgi:hypothetical protein
MVIFMKTPTRRAPFTFAEIVIGAPWAASLLRNDQDNDKAGMLHCNNAGDEWSPGVEPPALRELERDARHARAQALVDATARAGRRIAAFFRTTRARLATQR